MARRRTTFGKLDRDRDKQAKAKAKQERRAAARADHGADQSAPAPSDPAREAAILVALSQLHESYDRGELSLEDFETRRRQLSGELHIT